MKKLRFLVPALVFAGVVVFTGCSNTANGDRDVSERGAIQTLEGTLAYDDSEWYLETEGDRYALDLGDHDFLESNGIALREGSRAEVRGFVDGDEIAPVSVDSDGNRYTLRGEDGPPPWAGKGDMRNQDAEGDGRGRNRAESADGEGQSYGRGRTDAQDEGARGRGRQV